MKTFPENNVKLAYLLKEFAFLFVLFKLSSRRRTKINVHCKNNTVQLLYHISCFAKTLIYLIGVVLSKKICHYSADKRCC
jgi:hypothetical protein